ncbi:MAG: transketolase C-terminal domain-containing protein, partial [Pseudomonadota bacterium]|nr:transketolase C-terminal domain-containing protein [Pseudomonadota bacterium]
EGNDLTIASTSYMTIEALRAAEMMENYGISAEVIDIQTLNPLDDSPVVDSVRKTGHLIVADTGWTSCGFAGEIVARVAEKAFDALKSAPQRVALPDAPTPTSPKLTEHYYPRAADIIRIASTNLNRALPDQAFETDDTIPHDVPDNRFTGPF